MRWAWGSMPGAQRALNERIPSARSCADSRTLCTPMIAVGLIASNRGDEILRRRLLVGVGLLKIEDVLSARFEQAIDVEHRDARLRLASLNPSSIMPSTIMPPMPVLAKPAPRNSTLWSSSFAGPCEFCAMGN